MAAVEGQHREEVEDPHEEVDGDEDEQEVPEAGLRCLAGGAHRPHDGLDPGAVGRRLLSRLGLVPWSNRWTTPLGEKRCPTPTIDAQLKWTRSDPVEARAWRGVARSTGEPRLTPMTPYGASPAGATTPASCTLRPSAGVTVSVLVRPPRSTTKVTGVPGWSRTVPVSAPRLPATGLPSIETTTSPGWIPATAAGPGFPPTGATPWICTLSALGTPTRASSAHNRTRAIRKCMADPATATRSRAWNGCWR